MTGGRLKRLEPWLRDETVHAHLRRRRLRRRPRRAAARFTARQGRLATVTAVRPPARFGGMVFDGDRVAEFTEKPQIGEGWINGGFMVLEPEVFDYIEGDDAVLEIDALERLAADGQLAAYRHERFWQCMDTLRDKRAARAALGRRGRALEGVAHERRSGATAARS